MAYLKGACHCSFSSIRKFLRDVVGITISRGQLRKVCAKVSDSLQDAYHELLKALPAEDVLNVDETGHKEIKRRTRVATLFPNEASLLRLVSAVLAVLAEVDEEWQTGKCYLNTETD